MIKFLIKIRSLIQTFFLILLNHDFNIWRLLFKNKTAIISRSPLKYLCAPGLNCYSCPSAVTSCPIGALQFALNDIALRLNLREKINLSVLYIAGFLGLTGMIGGRIFCGWVCPFGFVQNLINRITGRNFKILKHSAFKYTPLFFLTVFVIILPLFAFNITAIYPWFCKYICPEGTLKAGIPLLLFDGGLRYSVHFVTLIKFILLAATAIMLLLSKRFFCKYICPLGAVWGLFNKISFLRLNIKQTCTKCGACKKACPMHIEVYKNPNDFSCVRCGDCIKSCPSDCIHFSFSLYDKDRAGIKNRIRSGRFKNE